jgi:hypothetical protein
VREIERKFRNRAFVRLPEGYVQRACEVFALARDANLINFTGLKQKWIVDALLSRIGLGVTPESADVLGWQVLGAGAVLFVVGRLLARTGAKPQAV